LGTHPGRGFFETQPYYQEDMLINSNDRDAGIEPLVLTGSRDTYRLRLQAVSGKEGRPMAKTKKKKGKKKGKK
jgi:hypothetical protein